jgi:hypothetical protein
MSWSNVIASTGGWSPFGQKCGEDMVKSGGIEMTVVKLVGSRMFDGFFFSPIQFFHTISSFQNPETRIRSAVNCGR